MMGFFEAPAGGLEKLHQIRHSSESCNPEPLLFNGLKSLDDQTFVC